MIIYSTNVKCLLLICAIKIGATASYKAVPSMLIVAPTGNTKRVTLESIFKFSSRHLNVTGRVAELKSSKIFQLINFPHRKIQKIILITLMMYQNLLQSLEDIHSRIYRDSFWLS